MNTDNKFNAFKYSCWACDQTVSECNASSAADRDDCECCNTRGQVCCSAMCWAITPFTLLVDIFACGPRYIHHKCHGKKKPVITIQPY